MTDARDRNGYTCLSLAQKFFRHKCETYTGTRAGTRGVEIVDEDQLMIRLDLCDRSSRVTVVVCREWQIQRTCCCINIVAA